MVSVRVCVVIDFVGVGFLVNILRIGAVVFDFLFEVEFERFGEFGFDGIFFVFD